MKEIFETSFQKKTKKIISIENETSINFLVLAIQCPQPLVPINGRIDGTSGSASHRRYAVGALVTFSCTEGHLLVGEASIVCTETGFWSHPPPFCK